MTISTNYLHLNSNEYMRDPFNNSCAKRRQEVEVKSSESCVAPYHRHNFFAVPVKNTRLLSDSVQMVYLIVHMHEL